MCVRVCAVLGGSDIWYIGSSPSAESLSFFLLLSLFFSLSLPVRSQALIKRERSEETQDTKCKMVASYWLFFSPSPVSLLVEESDGKMAQKDKSGCFSTLQTPPPRLQPSSGPPGRAFLPSTYCSPDEAVLERAGSEGKPR
jgi:hypothetical protein